MSGDIEKFGKEKESWLEEFANQRSDLFYPESWTDEQKAEVDEVTRPNRMKTTMFSSIPMNCQGKKCPVGDVCPLLAKNLAPVGKPCPIELKLVQEISSALIEELNVNVDSFTEVSSIRVLVDNEIQYLRASKKLSLEDFITDDVVGVNESTGEPIFKKSMHVAVDMQDRVLKRRKEILNQFMATREQKVKAGQGQLDTAQSIASMFTELREIEIQADKLKRRKLGIEDQDDYITEAEIIED